MWALRYMQILAVVIWLGGLIALGAVAAPAIFEVLQHHDPVAGRILAGDLFGAILGRFHPVTYGCGLVLMTSLVIRTLLGPRPARVWLRLTLVTSMLAVSLYTALPLTRQIVTLQREIGGPVSALPDGDSRRTRFGRLHGLSTLLMMMNAVGGLVLLYLETED